MTPDGLKSLSMSPHTSSSSPTIRRAVELLPPLGVTGIGSLPHTQSELALQMALQADIPYLPQLPINRPTEFMVPEALERLPGLSCDEEGLCLVDLDAWRAARGDFDAELEAAFSSGRLEAFEPSPEASRLFRPFLFEITERKLALVKLQIAGPCTVRWVARLANGDTADTDPALDAQIFRLVLARALAMVKAVRRTGATPLFFIDEPGLFALQPKDPRHLLALQELKVLVAALHREGALVGLHCCSNTHWDALLALGLDVLAIDVRLSLDALLEEQEALARFVEGGATLSLGIIPTDVASQYSVEELVDAVDASLRSALSPAHFNQLSQRLLLTPACGLAMRSVADAERIVGELRSAQRRLRQLWGSASRQERPLVGDS